ncbi:hypothetical protein R3P38DRAFT_2775086 [Favolaschia claudopus]|uniref:Uncharacterized protein n=1 Tax=Favolaschia claudopus TaxID=2862362 RepID=A0AAW0BX81_9AGAR
MSPFVLQQMTIVLVQYMRNYINSRNPPWERTQSAWLFPDGDAVLKRLWVTVPVIKGRKRAYKATQLETGLWIDCARGVADGTINGSKTSVRVDNFPFTDVASLKHSFTVVCADQSDDNAVGYPTNALIMQLVPELAMPWKGNILVFKTRKNS